MLRDPQTTKPRSHFRPRGSQESITEQFPRKKKKKKERKGKKEKKGKGKKRREKKKRKTSTFAKKYVRQPETKVNFVLGAKKIQRGVTAWDGEERRGSGGGKQEETIVEGRSCRAELSKQGGNQQGHKTSSKSFKQLRDTTCPSWSTHPPIVTTACLYCTSEFVFPACTNALELRVYKRVLPFPQSSLIPIGNPSSSIKNFFLFFFQPFDV